MKLRPKNSSIILIVFVLVNVAFLSCQQKMADQPKYKPLEASSFFEDGASSRTLIKETVPRGHLRADKVFYEGKDKDGNFVSEVPVTVDLATLKRGQERYNISCSPCHGYTGYGDGMVVRRGFPKAASFHEERFANYPAGQLFQVISEGFGVMPGYAYQIDVKDRWAIIAYIEALRLSQNVNVFEHPEVKKEIQ